MATTTTTSSTATTKTTTTRVFEVNRGEEKTNLEICFHSKEAWNIHEVCYCCCCYCCGYYY